MVEHVAVIGAGAMGRGLGCLFAESNVNVTIIDSSEESLKRAERIIQSKFLVDPERSKRTNRQQQHLVFSTSMNCIYGSNLVIEAVPENLQIKQSVFREIEKHTSPDTIIATNTSGLSINKITCVLQRPERALGTHFFMPADAVPLVEIVKGDATSAQIVEKTREFLRKIGKKPVIINQDIPGFVANRIQHAMCREAIALLEAGIASAEDIDTIVRYSIGVRLINSGPLEQRDLNGLDVHYHIASYLYKDLENRTVPSQLLTEKVKKGELGVKTGRGFFEWKEDSETVFNQKNEQLLRLLKWMKDEKQGGMINVQNH